MTWAFQRRTSKRVLDRERRKYASSSIPVPTHTHHTPHTSSFPILLPPKPYLVLRDTLCSCEAYGMRPMYKKKKRKKKASPGRPRVATAGPLRWWPRPDEKCGPAYAEAGYVRVLLLCTFLSLTHRSHSISFTRAQGIPKYKIGVRRGK